MCKSVYKNISVKTTRNKEQCVYGVTLPGEYLQVARRWQRRCLCIWCYTWNSLGTSSPTSTRVTHRLRITRRLRVICRLRHRNFSVPTKETIPVYTHLGTHATSAVDSPKWKIVTMTYECTELSSAVLPLMALYITCSSGVPSATIASSREPREIKHKK